MKVSVVLLFGLRLLLGTHLVISEPHPGPSKTMVDITFQADAIIHYSSYTSFERELGGFLNYRMDDSFTVIMLAVRTQSMLQQQELSVQVEIIASLLEANGPPSRDLGDEVLATLTENSNALERRFQKVSLGLELGDILSIETVDLTASPFYSNDNPTRSPSHTPVPVSPALLPTLPPFTKAPTKSPKAPIMTKSPTPLPTKAPKDTLAPTTRPTDKGDAKEETPKLPLFPSVSPSSNPTLSTSPTELAPAETSAQATSSTSNFFTKSYQTEITVKIFGLFGEIPVDEIDTVERVTQEFIEETIPAVRSVIMEVAGVDLSDQMQVSNRFRQRRSVQDNTRDVLLLSFVVDGEGWSTNEELLDTLHFGDAASHGFLTNYTDYVSRLQLSSDTFKDLETGEPTDDEPPVVLSPASNNNDAPDGGRRSTVVLPVLLASLGTALLAGIICTFTIFGRRSDADSTETASTSNDKDSNDISMDVEYTDDQGSDYPFDEGIPRIISPATLKYPTQESRGNFTPLSEAFECCSSLQSPSMGSIDLDNWSTLSGPTVKSKSNNSTTINRSLIQENQVEVSFSMEALDEFEANLGYISPELMARRRLFEEEEYDDNP